MAESRFARTLLSSHRLPNGGKGVVNIIFPSDLRLARVIHMNKKNILVPYVCRRSNRTKPTSPSAVKIIENGWKIGRTGKHNVRAICSDLFQDYFPAPNIPVQDSRRVRPPTHTREFLYVDEGQTPQDTLWTVHIPHARHSGVSFIVEQSERYVNDGMPSCMSKFGNWFDVQHVGTNRPTAAR